MSVSPGLPLRIEYSHVRSLRFFPEPEQISGHWKELESPLDRQLNLAYRRLRIRAQGADLDSSWGVVHNKWIFPFSRVFDFYPFCLRRRPKSSFWPSKYLKVVYKVSNQVCWKGRFFCIGAVGAEVDWRGSTPVHDKQIFPCFRFFILYFIFFPFSPDQIMRLTIEVPPESSAKPPIQCAAWKKFFFFIAVCKHPVVAERALSRIQNFWVLSDGKTHFLHAKVISDSAKRAHFFK